MSNPRPANLRPAIRGSRTTKLINDNHDNYHRKNITKLQKSDEIFLNTRFNILTNEQGNELAEPVVTTCAKVHTAKVASMASRWRLVLIRPTQSPVPYSSVYFYKAIALFFLLIYNSSI